MINFQTLKKGDIITRYGRSTVYYGLPSLTQGKQYEVIQATVDKNFPSGNVMLIYILNDRGRRAAVNTPKHWALYYSPTQIK